MLSTVTLMRRVLWSFMIRKPWAYEVTIRDTVKEKTRKLSKTGLSEGSWAVSILDTMPFLCVLQEFMHFSNCLASSPPPPQVNYLGLVLQRTFEMVCLAKWTLCRARQKRSLPGSVMNLTFLDMKNCQWNWTLWVIRVCKRVRALFADLDLKPLSGDGAMPSIVPGGSGCPGRFLVVQTSQFRVSSLKYNWPSDWKAAQTSYSSSRSEYLCWIFKDRICRQK